jgi:hypothetical protein
VGVAGLFKNGRVWYALPLCITPVSYTFICTPSTASLTA